MKLFISGTDTGVGKTWVSAAIASQALSLGQSVGYYKPIQTGTPAGQPPEDPDVIQTACEGRVTTYCRYCFEPPVAPSVADTERRIDPAQIARDVEDYHQRHDLLLVEGAGGLAVPISPTLLMLDLIEQLQLPVLLVARSQLGTINHTLLSIQALEQRNLPLLGVVFNGYPANPSDAELAVQTLLPIIRNHVPATLPLWTSAQASSFSARHLTIPVSVMLSSSLAETQCNDL